MILIKTVTFITLNLVHLSKNFSQSYLPCPSLQTLSNSIYRKGCDSYRAVCLICRPKFQQFKYFVYCVHDLTFQSAARLSGMIVNLYDSLEGVP